MLNGKMFEDYKMLKLLYNKLLFYLQDFLSFLLEI